jgi:hypothetical protein
MEVGKCGSCKGTQKSINVQYYKIILIYGITFIGNYLIILADKYYFSNMLTPFFSIDTFSIFKILLRYTNFYNLINSLSHDKEINGHYKHEHNLQMLNSKQKKY